MTKDSTYTEKFSMLKEWTPALIESIKKDLKNEHLKRDFQFVKKYFGNCNIQKLTAEELTKGYSAALEDAEQTERLAEFMANRWLLRNSELYQLFEEKLQQINPNFNELEELTTEQSQDLMQSAIKAFGATKTYLFSVLNSVVFPKDVYEKLAHLARNESKQSEEKRHVRTEQKSIDDIKRDYEAQIQRITDRYEKKLMGLMKKYQQDVEGFKKQISSLQRKLVG